MSEHRWRRPPSRPALVGLLNKLAPGSKLLGISRLKGGLEAGMFSVLYLHAFGSQERLVVRQTSGRDEGAADRAKREFATMSLLRDAGVPVPDPMLLDAEGNLLGTPSIVMAHAGEVVMQPDDRAEWLQGLADAMLKLHAVTPKHFNLSHLQNFGREAIADEIGEGLEAGSTPRSPCQAGFERAEQAPEPGRVARSLSITHGLLAPPTCSGRPDGSAPSSTGLPRK
jgi:aminoglycoside phosphotransferase (APT) family kinase protein